MPRIQTVEDSRLEEARSRKKHWKRWGPYLSERQWGTVREDYSGGPTPWDSVHADRARSRTYRWGEDGIGGISDRRVIRVSAMMRCDMQYADIKERLFGLNGHEG